MKKLIAYFNSNHLLTNLIMVACFAGGIIFWNQTSKEELPDVTMNFVRVSANYLGASAEEMEDFVARPLETEIKGIDGIEEINTTVGNGFVTIMMDISDDVDDFNETLNEIRTAVANADLPSDMQDDPSVRYFKTSQKAIIDVYITMTNKPLLDEKARDIVQDHARTLSDRLLSLPQISDVNFNSMLDYRYVISIYPEMLMKHEISINQIITAIRNNNIRIPLGAMELETQKVKKNPSKKPGAGFFQSKETKLTLDADLISIEDINNVIVRGNFEGKIIRVKDLARVYSEYTHPDSIRKINGLEAVGMTVTKSGSYGILESVDEVKRVVNNFQSSTLSNSTVKVILSDDESLGIRNRLSFIAQNGILGFVLVLITLFIFLNWKAGFWVAMGIPFSFTLTMIIASLSGFTINNITLAAVIIVMGMVVDDAIVVRENITRMKEQGMDEVEAAVTGTSYVLLPIFGSILTTCFAFIPVLSFGGRMGKMVSSMPPIIFMILGASLIESILILPSHLSLHIPRKWRVIMSLGTLPLIEKYFANRKKKLEKKTAAKVKTHAHWFYKVERAYEILLHKVLTHKWILLSVFILLFFLSGYLFKSKMKFVMFPRSETTEVFVMGETAKGWNKTQTEKKVREIEDYLKPFLTNEVEEIVTDIARGRWGTYSPENRFRMQIYLVDKEKRKKSTSQLVAEWSDVITNMPGFYKPVVTAQRFGFSSGTALEINVQGKYTERYAAVNELLTIMSNDKRFQDPEIEQVQLNSEYRIHLNRDEINRLGISAGQVSEAFRTIAGGSRLYTHIDDDEEIDYVVLINTNRLKTIKQVLTVPVANSMGYMVPLQQLVVVDHTNTPSTINRLNGKSIVRLYSDLSEDADMSPLEAAEYLEANIFPSIQSHFPSVTFNFQGEVMDSRETMGELLFAVILVLLLIYMILALLFKSLTRPFIIMTIIPFGAVGIILAFMAHGMFEFGFFAAIGALGLVGVVVNDSIVMISKLDKEFHKDENGEHIIDKVSSISKTRLRAVVLTTLTTVAGLMPSAYGIFGYDAMLAEMMLALSWGLLFGTLITLFLVPAIYTTIKQFNHFMETKVFKSILSISIIVLLGAGVFNTSHAQETPANMLSLKQYLVNTKQNNLQFQLMAIDQLKVQYDYDLMLPEQDLMVSALFDLYYKTIDQSLYTGMGLGLSKMFATTGTELSFSYSASPSSPLSSSVSSSLSLDVSQPILANAFGLLQRMNIKNASLIRDITLFEIQEAYEDYVEKLFLTYYNWYSLYEQKRIAESSLNLIRQTKSIVQKKYNSRIADIADLNRAQIQVLEQENQVKALNNKLRTISLELAKTMSLTNEISATPLFPDLSFSSPTVDFDQTWKYFIEHSRTIKVATKLAEQNRLNVDIAKQSFLPSLNATAGMTWADSSYNPFVSGSFHIGAEFAYVFPDSKDTATWNKAKLNAKQTSLSLSNIIINSQMDMKVFWENLRYQKEIIASLLNKIKLMEVVVSRETKTYQQGRSSLTELINEINKLRNYRLEYLLATIELERAYLSWKSNTDTLLSSLDTALKD